MEGGVVQFCLFSRQCLLSNHHSAAEKRAVWTAGREDDGDGDNDFKNDEEFKKMRRRRRIRVGEGRRWRESGRVGMRGILILFLPRRDDDAVHLDQTDGNAICLFGNIIHWRWKIHKPCWDQNVYRKYFINFVVIFLVFSQSSFSIWSCCVDTRINQSWIDIYWLIPQTIWDIDAGLFSSDITHFLLYFFSQLFNRAGSLPTQT